MFRPRSWEIYNAEGVELSFTQLNQEAAEFWHCPLQPDPITGKPLPATPYKKYWHDLYFAILEPITCRPEGLVRYDDLVGTMIGNLAGEIKINPRSFKMLIDRMAPYIRLVRHWQDKGYKIYSTRWDREEPLSKSSIKSLMKKWEEECPPSYAKFGDIQNFNPYL